MALFLHTWNAEGDVPGAWAPAPGCTHGGTCTSRNPWLCHADDLRPRAGYDTPQPWCSCTACHPSGPPAGSAS